jgi:outer membrane protein assembly factor BamE (lipoprotein component of BamABCDE complex)
MHLTSMLKTALLASILLIASGCVTSTPQSRISEHREAYNGFPAEAQRKISAGEVDVGFTPEMVRLALGKPSREFNRQTENGSTDVWVYHDNSPRISFGFGIGSYGRQSASSVGIATSTGGYDAEEKIRVEFREGKVTQIDFRKG